MVSKFIGEDKLGLYELYSREDVGYGGSMLSLMRINEHEKIGFFCFGYKYKNKLTEKGFFLNPRKDLNNERFISDLNKCTTKIKLI